MVKPYAVSMECFYLQTLPDCFFVASLHKDGFAEHYVRKENDWVYAVLQARKFFNRPTVIEVGDTIRIETCEPYQPMNILHLSKLFDKEVCVVSRRELVHNSHMRYWNNGLKQ